MGPGTTLIRVLAGVMQRLKGYMVTRMWLAAACNEANISAAPTSRLIATARTKVRLDRMGVSPVCGADRPWLPAGKIRPSWRAYSLIVAVQRNDDIRSDIT